MAATTVRVPKNISFHPQSNGFYDIVKMNGKEFAIFNKETKQTGPIKLDLKKKNVIVITPIESTKDIKVEADAMLVLCPFTSTGGSISFKVKNFASFLEKPGIVPPSGKVSLEAKHHFIKKVEEPERKEIIQMFQSSTAIPSNYFITAAAAIEALTGLAPTHEFVFKYLDIPEKETTLYR